MKDRQINAVFAEEAGEVKCGNCGKTLLIYIRKRPKSAKVKDEIVIKCPRCKQKNSFEM